MRRPAHQLDSSLVSSCRCRGSIQAGRTRQFTFAGAAMSHLIVIVYPTESKAEEVRQTLLGLQKEYVIKLGDAVIATKTDAGKIKLNQLINTTTTGAVSGSFWGLLVGVLFLTPLLGVAVGAASGA